MVGMGQMHIDISDTVVIPNGDQPVLGTGEYIPGASGDHRHAEACLQQGSQDRRIVTYHISMGADSRQFVIVILGGTQLRLRTETEDRMLHDLVHGYLIFMIERVSRRHKHLQFLTQHALICLVIMTLAGGKYQDIRLLLLRGFYIWEQYHLDLRMQRLKSGHDV